MQSARVRYVSVGAGGLLFDLELLLALRRQHGPASLELVVVIDRKYCFDHSAVTRLASLLGPETDVFAFSHVDSYLEQVRHHPETFGGASCFVQSDCDDVDDAKAAELAVAALAPCGVALLLRGDGTLVDLGGGFVRDAHGRAAMRRDDSLLRGVGESCVVLNRPRGAGVCGHGGVAS